MLRVEEILKSNEGKTLAFADSETLFALKNFAHNIYFDEQPYIKGSVKDLDWQAIKDLFKRHHKEITPYNAHSIGLTTNAGTKEVPTFGGMVLFGINRNKLFPEAIIRCARFLGVDKNSILDQVVIETYLPLALEEALKFIQRNTRQGAIIKALAREDIPQYPLVALREAITNAIVHADYTIKGVYLSIAIFDDRIEITNPGGLPFGFTMERALAGSSRIRNRVYAEKITPTAHFTWEKELVNFLKKKQKISTKKAAELWEVTPRTARLRLVKLIDKGIIQKTGTSLSDPQGDYVLK